MNNGPPNSANGGYACGLLATAAQSYLDGRIAVSLHRPPPLETNLTVRPAGWRVHLWTNDGDLIGGAVSTTARIDAPPPLPAPLVRQAADRFRGPAGHPFPTCFVCGVVRTAGDGLNLRPGPVADRAGVVACDWSPDATVAGPDGIVEAAMVWAVLDCPCGWTTDPVARPRVLSWMSARIDALPALGRRYAVAAQVNEIKDRTAATAAVLFEVDTGVVLAEATSIWTTV